MAEVLTLPKARVPVVKFVVPKTGTKVCGWGGGGGGGCVHAGCARRVLTATTPGLGGGTARAPPPPHPPTHAPTQVDVTVNNLLACVNTKLLADYCAIDSRLAPLVALVKHWAKQRAVNDP